MKMHSGHRTHAASRASAPASNVSGHKPVLGSAADDANSTVEQSISSSNGLDTAVEARNRQKPVLDWFDRRIVRFVVLWVPYGGFPDDDAMPRFGMNAVQLRRRFNRIVERMAEQRAALSAEDAALLAEVDRAKRMWIGAACGCRCTGSAQRDVIAAAH